MEATELHLAVAFDGFPVLDYRAPAAAAREFADEANRARLAVVVVDDHVHADQKTLPCLGLFL
ncbi:hypothetical protein [Nocardia salmonicida]|uniref:hypothetical protein n=1 Tax=Nocardia salmonicida TaxID=53431 RepID=UPI0007A4EFF2|nr:hypothetical protein [Nocardia salmonicida]MBC7299543.1 hypothetical protein [Nocardia sp.]